MNGPVKDLNSEKVHLPVSVASRTPLVYDVCRCTSAGPVDCSVDDVVDLLVGLHGECTVV